MASRIIGRVQQLKERRTDVEIHWVLGHMSVKRNEKSDKVAKEVVEKADIQRCTERFISLTYV